MLVYYFGRLYQHADKSQTYSVEADNAELRHYGAFSSQFPLFLAAVRS